MTGSRPNPTQRAQNQNRPNDNRNDRGSGQSNQANNSQPSPWLMGESPERIDPTSSFVEYLRWMRSGDHPQKDGTKVQMLTLCQDKANYQKRLQVLTDRTKKLAGQGNWFVGKCADRIRVGGYRGVESMLLPAVDALGIPFIPSSTLRGIARNTAMREFMQEKGMSWQEAETKVAPYFGSLEAEPENRIGKVIFLDAYPSPENTKAGLTSDIANNIWKWENNQLSPYSPNPNPFLSLENCSFVIGIKPLKPEYKTECDRIKAWLIKGLAEGIGSQVNAGYGVITVDGVQKSEPFFRVEFAVRGQLIHGAPRFNQWEDRNGWRPKTGNTPEVRAIAFKSMLRYWFRVIGLGVLPPERVKELEAEIFGSISPQKHGYLRVRIRNWSLEREEPRNEKDNYGEQEGCLEFYYSPELKENKKEFFKKLIKHLTWLMFHMGGIGQGARRPLYKRSSKPFWRGCNLVVILDEDASKEEEEFWDTPDELRSFCQKFQQNLRNLYTALSGLTNSTQNSFNNPRTNGQVSRDTWQEALDRNAMIFACTGQSPNNKPYGLSILHSNELKCRGNYDPYLCGKADRQEVIPSPVWISNPDKKYQVVTVFGATQNPRGAFVQKLKNAGAIQIFPLPQNHGNPRQR